MSDAAAKTSEGRLIEHGPLPGDWNMAVDSVLLDSAVRDGLPILRWYQWSQETVSLGYFQRPEEVCTDARLLLLPAVRRLTGGGAIVHAQELTYSLVVPATHAMAKVPTELYGIVHRALISALKRQGWLVALRGYGVDLDAAEPVLCFSRQDMHDVVGEFGKVIGSAQRRRRGAILQHGSVLCGPSTTAPEFPGLQRQEGSVLVRPDLPCLIAEVSKELACVLSVVWQPGELTEAEAQESHEQVSMRKLWESSAKNV